MKKLKSLESPHNTMIDEKFHQLNLGNIGNVVYWLRFFEAIAPVPGDIVECGVGRGRSLVVMAALNYFLSKEEGGQRALWGYDSFEGFPLPTKQDDSPRKPQKGEWSASPSGKYQYSPEFIHLVLTEAGIPPDRHPSLVKGFFGDTLKSHPDHPIALLNVDGDLYQSYKDTLNNLYPKVAKGGIIVFDDFSEEKNDEAFPGARLAVKEFLGEDFKKLKMSIGGTYYFVKE